jgi:hypothetical protein
MVFNSFVDGVVGTSARVNTPMGLLPDGAGGVYFVSVSVSPAFGVISDYAEIALYCTDSISSCL